jgi:hypothetical protein
VATPLYPLGEPIFLFWIRIFTLCRIERKKPMAQRHRDQAHAQEMFEKVERFLASALLQTEFCRQEGLGYSPFRYWLKSIC